MAEVQAAIDQRDVDRIAYWTTAAPAYRWNEIALAAAIRTAAMTSRVGALLNVAIYDATIAAWDAKYTYNRPRPADLEPGLVTSAPTPASPAYPSEHAVTAGAAATVLAYVIPGEAATFEPMAEEAARAVVQAGIQFPSDVRAGLELGRAVGERVVEYARGDHVLDPWTGTIPEVPGQWSLKGYPPGTVPFFPNASTWKTWVLSSPSQHRTGPPLAFDSPELAAQLAEVKNFPRTFQTNQAAFFWHPMAYPRWLAILNQKLFETGLDENPPRAARAYALGTISEFDALAAVLDSKWTYMAIRPFQLDPTLTTLFQTPAHPELSRWPWRVGWRVVHDAVVPVPA